MSESSLSLGYRDLMKSVGLFLGYPSPVFDLAADDDASNWSDQENADVQEAIHSGTRMFYSGAGGYVWTFLRPVTTIYAWPSVAEDSDVTVSSSTTTLTATAASFYPSMVGKTISFETTADAVIAGYTSSTVVTLAEEPASAISGEMFSIEADGTYRLPDDFGGMAGPLTYGTTQAYGPIPIRGEAEIRRLQQGSSNLAGYPEMAAIRAVPATGALGTRHNLVLWPTPVALAQLSYRYRALPGKLTSSAPYPYGGPNHSETIKACCLAYAEKSKDDDVGLWEATADKRMKDSIEQDRHLFMPDHFGPYGDRTQRRRDYLQVPRWSYDGVVPGE